MNFPNNIPQRITVAGRVRLFCLCFVLILCNYTKAQSTYPNATIQDQIKTNNDEAWELMEKNPKKASQLAEQALHLATESGDFKGQGIANTILGLIYENQKNLERAETYFLNALVAQKKRENNTRNILLGYYYLGQLYKDAHFDKAADYFRKGLAYPDVVNHPKEKLILHNSYGMLLCKEGKYPEAWNHLDSSLELSIKKGSSEDKANAYLNLSKLYLDMGDYSRATPTLQKSYSLYSSIPKKSGIFKSLISLGTLFFEQEKFDTAQIYYEEALRLDLKSGEDYYITLRNLASTYYHLGQTKKARDLYDQVLPHFEQTPDRRLAYIYFDLGSIAYDENDCKTAIQRFKQALPILEKADLPALQCDIYLLMAACYQEQGAYEEAAHYSNEYLSLVGAIQQQKTQVLNSLLDVEEARTRDALLKMGETNKSLELEKKSKRTMIIYGIIGFFVCWLLLAIAVLYNYTLNQKRQLAYSRIDELLVEKELESNYARLEQQEVERNRIAQDLHDRLGSMLSVVKLSLGSIESRITEYQEENRKHYQQANKLLDEACDEVRKIAYDLKNSLLAKFGIKAALESLIKPVQESGVEVELLIFGLNDRLENKIEVNIYRIIQELLGNTLKHAEASKISIQLNYFENLLNLTYEDNGIGFDLEKAEEKESMGLKNISSRVNDLEGTLNIDTKPGNGMTTMIDIPCKILKPTL